MAIFLCGCGDSSPAKPQAQKPIKGCGIPAKWVPELILEDMVVEGFHAENAVKDPDALAELNTLFTQGRPGSSLDFEKWFAGNEDRPQIAVRGMTMAQWESLFMRTEFPHQPEVYPAVCGGWTFEGYLQKHPDINSQTYEDYMKKFPIPGFPSATNG
ncbi:hypothetical protein KGQ20_34495 [Catenulispora sp. NF23]|uniref:Lipoprotein n=1 Tax=Catenulispora pinistramenti TaxID=2705254 RepID=A0ABS5L2T9_9ACTN|nr:hypothetical protein [Catenulispora pinistramenti]MBS2537876.1 hypothetical protein [Catenulispora pinistramenti]MBS2552651.1 hypothetical protein [Catenulispora pinistramenti]